jgi:ankyrin repeat protein
MKHLLLTTIAAVVMVGCGESQQSAPASEAKTEPPTAKAPDISFHDAAALGNNEAVKQHLTAGTDVNAKDESGWTPLHWAASKVHNKTAKLLIKEGADVNAVNKDGLSPLDYAENETFGFLIDHGAKSGAELKGGEPVVEATQSEPPTAKAPEISIHDAARTGNIEAVKQHLADGAEVNAKSSGGRTPLHWAANRGHEEVAELLIAKGAEVNAMDVLLGWTPLDYAEGETADLLRKHGGKTGEELKAEGN